MAKRLSIEIGRKFHWLTVLGEEPRKFYPCGRSHRCFKLQCVCGKTTTAVLGELASGKMKSCGCWKDRNTVLRSTKHGHCPRGNEHPLYRVWLAMINRCHRPGTISYKYYGTRGITVCEEWKTDFARFLGDMGERPAGRSLDRIDNSKGYCKENCRWATPAEQGLNKRNNVFITLNGVTRHLLEWSRILKISSRTLRTRRRAGDSPEEMLRPVHRKLNPANTES